ncbi:hypothetical protein PMKS-001334 [Pichia membranifaciens]|uniref:Protein kinase domain-containing protein n=1 Tax=Pichia membranifaciens TaxID=4926 RepID=A0A1Q2YE62_9ASCO|nr:hypothetical protein PMKS-001334 [Pichia membranifaciens]
MHLFLHSSEKSSRKRTQSVSSQRTVSSASSSYSFSSSPQAQHAEPAADLSLKQPDRDELLKVCKANDPGKLNNLDIPYLSEYFIMDTIEALDEGSSGSILKAKKTAVFKGQRYSPVLSAYRSPSRLVSQSSSKLSSSMQSLSLDSPRSRSNSSFKTFKPMNRQGEDENMKSGEREKEGEENEGEENEEAKPVIRPMYTFDSLNEYLILASMKSKHISSVHGLFRYGVEHNDDTKEDEDDHREDDGGSFYSMEGNDIDDSVKSFDEQNPVELNSEPIDVCLLLDYYSNSDLLRLTTGMRKKNIAASSLFKDAIFAQLVQGLKYLHQQGIVHRDIKPENILIDEEGCLKYADFGYAIDLNRIEDYPIGEHDFLSRGTTSFKAPEIMKVREKFDGDMLKATDVWSLAVLYYQMKFLNKPWRCAVDEDGDYKKYRELFTAKKLDSLRTGFDIKRAFGSEDVMGRSLKSVKDDIVIALTNMMNPNPHKRWTVSDVFRSDWMVGTRMLIEEEDKGSSAAGSRGKNGEDNEIVKVLRVL